MTDKTPRMMTFIGRGGRTVRTPNHSGDEIRRMAKESGLEQIMQQGGANPMELMSAMMSFNNLAGTETFDAPPEDVMRKMTGGMADKSYDVDGASPVSVASEVNTDPDPEP
jgi:hypothetical protein